MIGSKLSSFADETKLNNKGELIYGDYEGYEVSLYELNGEKTLFVDFYLPEDQQLTRDAIRKFMSDSNSQYYIQSSSLSNTGLKIVFQNKSGVYENIKDFFYTLIYFLKSKNIPGSDVCTNCGKKLDSVSVVSIEGNVHTCCPECAKKLTGSNKAAVNLRAKKNIFIGGIGALIGAIAGACVWVAVAYNGFFALWCGVVIALFIRFGYILFGGKPSKAEVFFNILFAIPAVAGAEFLSECISLWRTWSGSGYVFKVEEIFRTAFNNLISAPRYYMPYLEAAGIGFAFALLTVLALTNAKKRSNKIFSSVELLAQ